MRRRLRNKRIKEVALRLTESGAVYLDELGLGKRLTMLHTE